MKEMRRGIIRWRMSIFDLSLVAIDAS